MNSATFTEYDKARKAHGAALDKLVAAKLRFSRAKTATERMEADCAVQAHQEDYEAAKSRLAAIS